MIYNQWYAILPSKSVVKNKILAVKRLNLNLALFRDEEGVLGCVVNQCSHRGATLDLGKVKGNCIQCPFHGIEFDKEGKCTFIPASGKASKENMNRFNVQHYLVKEAHGIIYLWYGDLEKADEKLPFFDDYIDNTYIYSEMEDHWSTHYSRCIENQLDVIHLPFVHYNTIGRGNKTLVNGPKTLFENNILTTSANNEVDEGQMQKDASQCVIKETNINFMFPNIWMNLISPKIKVIIYFAPVDDENTILYIRFYCKITQMKWLDSIIAYFGKHANRIIENQDKRIVITQEPKASSLKCCERLLKGDGPIIMYRRIREELKSSNQKL